MKKAFRKPVRTAGAATAVPSSSPTVQFAAALTAHRDGRLAEAEAGYREVLRLEPRHPHANNNLGILLRASQRNDEAVVCYRRAVAAGPDDPGIRSNLSCLLSDLGRTDEAMAELRRALALQPAHAESLFNLSNVLRSLGSPAAGRIACERAVRVKPDFAEAHANFADFLKGEGKLQAAVQSYTVALRLRPGMLEPLNNLGETLKEQGRVEEAIAFFQKALEQHPTSRVIHSNLLFALHYTPNIPPDVIFRAHALWGQRHAAPLLPANRRFPNDRSPGRRLRVGYVSPDFCTHSCAFFSEPLLRHHDRAAVEIFCYPTSRREDVTTTRFRALSDHWRPLVGLDDEAAAALIARDGIDILVDLAGHTGENRLMLFARKPAPVQATWLGYPDSTGMTAMDFRITDGIADPMKVTDRWHTECLVRLPRGFLAFQPALQAEPRLDPPVLENGYVTFGSFNNNSKVTPAVVRVWAEILKRVPGSRMVVKSRALGDEPTREGYARLFESCGVARERVDLLARIDPAANHFRAYDRVDIGLDPFPYNGTTTTCEALWMGVPVITLAGGHHVARVGASLLTQVGLPELIATDEEDYIRRAVALAGDRARLSELRRTMTDRLKASPLTDYAGFARKMETAYRAMWHDWLSRGAA